MGFEQPSNSPTVFALTERSPSTAVVRAVAETAELATTDIPPLYDAIDPDALDALFQGRTAGAVTVEYAGYPVTVRKGVEVVVQDPAAPPS